MTDEEMNKVYLARRNAFHGAVAHFRGQIPELNNLAFMFRHTGILDDREMFNVQFIGQPFVPPDYNNDNFVAGMC